MDRSTRKHWIAVASELSFTRGMPNWGRAFRYGLFRIDGADIARIAQAMCCAALASIVAHA